MSKTVRFAAFGQPAVVVQNTSARILHECRVRRSYKDWSGAIKGAAPATERGRIFEVEGHFPLMDRERDTPEVALKIVWFGAVKGSRVLAWGRLHRMVLAHAYDLFDLSEQRPDLPEYLRMTDGVGVASRPTGHRFGEGKCCGIWWPKHRERWASTVTFRTHWLDRTCFLFRDVSELGK